MTVAAINTSAEKARAIADMLISLGVGFTYASQGEIHAAHAHRIEVHPSRAELLRTCLALAIERQSR